jgi:hypothetical protein
MPQNEKATSSKTQTFEAKQSIDFIAIVFLSLVNINFSVSYDFKLS